MHAIIQTVIILKSKLCASYV